MIEASVQWLATNEQQHIASENKFLNPENSVNLANSDSDKVAVQLNAERLKFIDEISRLILELKKQFPELAEHLSKARDNFSASRENIPVKNLMKLLTQIQQNLNEPSLAETVKKFAGEITKILQPISEIPSEYKLILALSKNDFATVDIAAKNITQNAALQTQPPIQASQATPATQSFQIILNALQELKELGIPKELENTPLKELETIILQKTGIALSNDSAKSLLAAFSEKPAFATVGLLPTNQNVHFENAANIIEIPLPKNFPIQKIFENIPLNTPQNAPQNKPQNISPHIPQKVEMAFSLHQINTPKSSEAPVSKYILQPWPASVLIPKEERNFWLKTDLPLTPQILNIRDAILSLGKLPENPETVKLFANNLHELSLQTEQGANISKEQQNLLWRVISVEQRPVPNSFLKYQPLGNYEGELFKNLPEPVKRELLRELPAGKIWQPETLQKAIEKILEKYIEPQTNTANTKELLGKTHEEIRHILQNLKEQIQWTRIDQDTRIQNDRENVFYFMHNNELQKGRLKIKDERRGNSKKQQNSSISFSIETRTKNLGNVRADLTLSKNVLNIRLQDEIGTAGNAVKEERETLAKELANIGLELGELLYGKTPKIQNLPINKPEKKNTGFDIRA